MATDKGLEEIPESESPLECASNDACAIVAERLGRTCLGYQDGQ